MDLRMIAYVAGGGAVGWVYQRLAAGSCNGGCPLLSSPWRTVVWGGLVGLSLALAGCAKETKEVNKVAEGTTALQHVTDADFASVVKASDQPVLVDAYADWCGPCRMLGPQIEKVAAQMAGKLKVVKLNVDTSPQTSASLGVRSIPALFVFDGGKMVDSWVGYQDAGQITARLQSKISRLK